MIARGEIQPPSVFARVSRRLLDPDKHLDYVWMILFAALPLVISWWIGADEESKAGYSGYWEREIWVAMVVILPAVVWIFRWLMDRMAPVSADWPPPHVPAIVDLIETEAGKQKAYEALRSALLSPRNLIAAFLITFAVHVADLRSLAGFYLLTPLAVDLEPPVGELPPMITASFKPLGTEFSLSVEADWSTMFLDAESGVSKWECLGLNASAYAVQFGVLLIAILLVIFLVRHNLFFLSSIYQRRWVPEGEEDGYVHIDLDDDDRCFGFRQANDAFNIQILITAVAAAFILGSRIENVGPGTGLLPDAGQWMSVTMLAGALAIVSLPIAVKLLPFLRFRGRDRASASLVSYLREFLSDDAWDESKDPVEAVAARFAENAFWPTGNNRARPIFFFAFWAFCIVLVPDPRAIASLQDLPAWSPYASWAISGVLALGATAVLFAFLNGMLRYIDPRLVEPPEQRIPLSPRVAPIQASVFISYRRADTAAYAGRLCDGLRERLDSDQIFMDIATVELGADFVAAIEDAIASVQLMIVLIGPQWLTLEGDDGRPRIESPDDVVHREVALGLAREIKVLPVLVGGARMPSTAELPEDLEGLARYNAHELGDTRWAYDMGVLMEHLAKLPARDAPSRSAASPDPS